MAQASVVKARWTSARRSWRMERRRNWASQASVRSTFQRCRPRRSLLSMPPGNARCDTPGTALKAASAMVVGLADMQLVWAATRPPTSPSNRRNCIQGRCQHAAVMPVRPADGQAERRALGIDNQMPLVPALPRSVGLSPVSEPPFGLVWRRCRAVKAVPSPLPVQSKRQPTAAA